MARKPTVIRVGIPCPHCNAIIVINKYITKNRKFLIGINSINNVGPCPECKGIVRMKVDVTKGRKAKAKETAPVAEGEVNE